MIVCVCRRVSDRAVGAAGEWTLKHGCAVAYTDSAANFGFQGIEGERLDPANAPAAATS